MLHGSSLSCTAQFHNFETDAAVSRRETRRWPLCDTTAVCNVVKSQTSSTVADSPDGDHPRPESRVSRMRGWLTEHPFHLETMFAMAATALATIATPFLSFGIFVALERDTTILGIGAVFMAGSLLSAIGLAATVVTHTYSEIRHQGFSASTEWGLRSMVYGGTRTVETATAVVFLFGVVSFILAGAVTGSVPDLILLMLVVSVVPLHITVLAHAAVAIGRTITGTLLHGD